MAFDFSSDLQLSLTSYSSHYVSRLSKCTDFIRGIFTNVSLEQSYLLYCCFYAITYCTICQNSVQGLWHVYCSSTRCTAPTYQCSDYETELSMVFGISTWVDFVATHLTSFTMHSAELLRGTKQK